MNQKKPLKIFNPFEQFFDRKSSPEKKTDSIPSVEQAPLPPKGDYSEVDFEKLNTAYASQDEEELARVRSQLSPEDTEKQEHQIFFKKFKQDEEEYYMKRKREEEEKKMQEEQEKLDEKRVEQEAIVSESQNTIPKGIVRKNILGGSNKKADLNLPPEMKPGGGKQ